MMARRCSAAFSARPYLAKTSASVRCSVMKSRSSPPSSAVRSAVSRSTAGSSRLGGAAAGGSAIELSLGYMRLGQAVHGGEDVGLLIQARVDGHEALQRQRVAAVDAQHAVEHLHGDGALTAADGLLHQRREHLQRSIGTARA